MSKPVFLLVLPLVVASLATAREHHGNWIEVRSSHVTIVTSNEKQGRRIAVQFERMWAIFQQTYPKPEDNPGSPPLFVLAFRNKDQFRALEPGPYQSKKSLPLHGMFVRAADKNYILMRLDSQAGNPYPLVDHEYTHLFLSEEDGKLPLWLNEGLAQFYQSIEPRSGDPAGRTQ